MSLAYVTWILIFHDIVIELFGRQLMKPTVFTQSFRTGRLENKKKKKKKKKKKVWKT